MTTGGEYSIAKTVPIGNTKKKIKIKNVLVDISTLLLLVESLKTIIFYKKTEHI